jgi:hypothetical protein
VLGHRFEAFPEFLLPVLTHMRKYGANCDG